MVELCGARMVPGTSTWRPSRRPPPRSRCAPRASSGCSASGSSRSESQAILERLGFGVERARRRPRGRGPVLPPRRRAARGRPDRGGRAHPRPRQRCPPTLPARRAGDRRAARASSGCAGAIEDLLRARGLTRSSRTASSRPTRSTACACPGDDRAARVLRDRATRSARSSRRCARRSCCRACSRSRATTSRATPTSAAVRDGAACSSRTGSEQLPDEQLHLGVAAGRRLRAGDVALAGAQPADFYAAKGLLVALLDALGVDWRLADGGPAVPAPGPRRAGAGRRARGGLARRAAPARGRATSGSTTSSGHRSRWSSTSTSCCRPRSAEPRYEDLITYPAVRAGHRGRRGRGGRGADRGRHGARGGRPATARGRVFDLYRGEQVGEGKKSLALRLEFRSAERTLTDDEVAELREQIKRGARARDRGDACVSGPLTRTRRPAAFGAPLARACVVGASGFAGALAASSCGAIRGSRWRPSPRAARPAGGSTTSTRATACRSCWSSSTQTGSPGVDVALVSYPHGAAARRSSRSCASAG